MLSNYITYKRHYDYSPVSLDQIKAIESQVRLDLQAKIQAVDITGMKNAPFAVEYHSNWDRFAKVWQQYSGTVRKYSVIFGDDHSFSDKKKPAFVPNTTCLELFVRVQGHSGQLDKREIILHGHNCYPQCFEDFCVICERYLTLKASPVFVAEKAHEAFRARVATIVETQTLRDGIAPSLDAKDLDGAMRTAVILLEDELRKKCLWAGRKEAATQTGTDLAATAFSANNGCLIPPWPVATQASEGAHMIFRGFFMYLRNAWGHNVKVVGKDETTVADFIAFVQFLIKVIEQSNKR